MKHGDRFDTIEVTEKTLEKWKAPPFQRPLVTNAKVVEVAEQIRESGVIPGVLVLASIEGDRATYVLDGQHRIHAFRMSERETALADVRIMSFEDVAAMGEEFRRINTHLVTLKPDDVLRAMEPSTPALSMIRKACPFVGYGNVRRGDNGVVASMSMVIRCWLGSAMPTPVALGGGAVHESIRRMDEESAATLIKFLSLAREAWGVETHAVWNALNLGLVMWLYRKLVIEATSLERRAVKLNEREFRACMMALTGEAGYVDWLYGRSLSDAYRSAAYGRIKSIFAKRIAHERQLAKAGMAKLPQPEWASTHAVRS